jgi:hypothetical protein
MRHGEGERAKSGRRLGLHTCAVALLAAVAQALPAPCPTQSGSAPQSREQAALIEEQELLARKLARIVASMDRLAERFGAEGRVHAAKLLRDGLQHISSRHEGSDGMTLEERMTNSHEKLGAGQSMQSIGTQQAIIGELEALISILMDRPDLDELESEIERLQRQRRQLAALASEENALRQETEALREAASNEAQEELEAGIEAARVQQRELLTENERHGRQSGALNLERLEQELEALRLDQATDTEVFQDWDPLAAGPLGEAEQFLEEARRDQSRHQRLSAAVEELRDSNEANDPLERGRALEEEAEAARRAARASGDKSATQVAEALQQAAESLLEAGQDEAAQAAVEEELDRLAEELEREAKSSADSAANQRASARQALKQLEASSSERVREAAEAVRKDLERADDPQQEAAQAQAATEQAHRALRQAQDESEFLGQALAASQAENASRAEQLREGVQRLPQDLGQAGEQAQQALEEARDAMQEAAQSAEESQAEQSAESAQRAQESLRQAAQALAKGRQQQASDPSSSAAQSAAQTARAQEQLGQEVERLAEQAEQASLSEEAREDVKEALEAAAEAMQQAGQQMSEGKSATAAQSQREAGEALRQAGAEARAGVEPGTEEQRERAEELAREQERIEKELYEFQQRYEQESQESSPPLNSLDRARSATSQAEQSLEQGQLDQAETQEEQAEREIGQAMAELAQEEEQYQKLREEELLFQIAEEVRSIREAHELVSQKTREIEQGRKPGKSATRGQKLRLRKISREEEALATRAHEIETAIREEGSLVFAELVNRIERDLASVARQTSDAGGYRSDERVQALQSDISHHLTWLEEALEEEQERREEEQTQEPPPGGESPEEGENRLVPDVAELKLLSRLEIDVLDSIEELLVLYPELEEGGDIDPLLLEEIQRLAYRHERSTELFSEFRQRLGIEAPEVEMELGGHPSEGGGEEGEEETPE